MALKTPMAAIFERLAGTWSIRRHLKSALPGYPSGILEGTATFSTRDNTDSPTTTKELLYAEKGQLQTDSGFTLQANRKYIYRYDPGDDSISAWFVREDSKQLDGNEQIDYLFHELDMSHNGRAWIGQGDHLCEKDMYWAHYEFWAPEAITEETQLDIFGVQYKVKGPQKDYSSETAYQRLESK